MPMPTPESTPEKPWAILGIPRKQYAAARPWKKAGMPKERYAEMLNLIPHESMLRGWYQDEHHRTSRQMIKPRD